MRRHASPRVQHNHAREGNECHWSQPKRLSGRLSLGEDQCAVCPLARQWTCDTKAHDHWSSALPRVRDGIGTSATRAFRPLPDGTHALPRCCTQTQPTQLALYGAADAKDMREHSSPQRCPDCLVWAPFRATPAWGATTQVTPKRRAPLPAGIRGPARG